jgi:hypothetical protein
VVRQSLAIAGAGLRFIKTMAMAVVAMTLALALLSLADAASRKQTVK